MSTAFDHIPIYGHVGALDTAYLETPSDAPDLVVKSIVPYRRFAICIADDGLDSFGLHEGNYAVFREARWPDRECQVCLVRFGDEVTIRLVEGINATMVTLRVSGDKIPPVELEPTDFSIMGLLDGVIFEEFALIAPKEEQEFDWGC